MGGPTYTVVWDGRRDPRPLAEQLQDEVPLSERDDLEVFAMPTGPASMLDPNRTSQRAPRRPNGQGFGGSVYREARRIAAHASMLREHGEHEGAICRECFHCGSERSPHNRFRPISHAVCLKAPPETVAGELRKVVWKRALPACGLFEARS